LSAKQPFLVKRHNGKPSRSRGMWDKVVLKSGETSAPFPRRAQIHNAAGRRMLGEQTT